MYMIETPKIILEEHKRHTIITNMCMKAVGLDIIKYKMRGNDIAYVFLNNTYKE